MSHSVKTSILMVVVAVVLAACGAADGERTAREIPTLAQPDSRVLPTIIAAEPTARVLPTLRPTQVAPVTGDSRVLQDRGNSPFNQSPPADAPDTDTGGSLPFTGANPPIDDTQAETNGGDTSAPSGLPPISSVPPQQPETTDDSGGSSLPFSPRNGGNSGGSPFGGGDAPDGTDGNTEGSSLPFNPSNNSGGGSPFGGSDSDDGGSLPFNPSNNSGGSSPFGGSNSDDGGSSPFNPSNNGGSSGSPFGGSNSGDGGSLPFNPSNAGGGGTPFGGGGNPFVSVGSSRWFINGEQPVSVISCPDPSCEVIGSLEAGDSVELIAAENDEATEDDTPANGMPFDPNSNNAAEDTGPEIEISDREWIPIRFNGEIAYIFGAFIDYEEVQAATGGGGGLPFSPGGGGPPGTGGLPFTPGGNSGGGLPFTPGGGGPGGGPGSVTVTPRNGMATGGGTFQDRTGFDAAGANPLYEDPNPGNGNPGGGFPGGGGDPTCPPFLPNC